MALSRLHRTLEPGFEGTYLATREPVDRIRTSSVTSAAEKRPDGSHKFRTVNFRPAGRIATLTDARFWRSGGLWTDPITGAHGSTTRLRNRAQAARAGGAPGRELRRRARRLETEARGTGNHPARSRARRVWPRLPVWGLRRSAGFGAPSSCDRALSSLRLAGSAANGRTVPPVQRSEGGAS
jgi:hypothetical protein